MLKSLLVASCIACLISAGSQANDFDLRASPIPVSDCQLSDPSRLAFSQVRITGRGRAVALHCPLRVNHLELSTGGSDNDMTSFRIHYQDNDGRGSESQITVSLVRRSFAGQGPERLVLCEWNSNVQGPNSSLLTSSVMSCPYDISSGGFHHFEILMRTLNSTASEVRFNGIDFP